MADARATREDVLAAVREIRLEWYKVSLVYAAVDAAVAMAATGLALSVAVPASAFPAALGAYPVTAVAVGVGALVLCGEFAARSLSFSLDRFETVTPAVETALRTARDAAERGATDAMATDLYAEVCARLERASSAGLLDARRLAVTMAVAAVLCLGAVHAAVVGAAVDASTDDDLTGPDAGESGGGAAGPPATGAENTTFGDADEVLGTPTNVSSGTNETVANVSTSPGGDDVGGGRERAYETGGLPAETEAVGAAQAGYAATDEVENADIVREYNLRIRGGDDA